MKILFSVKNQLQIFLLKFKDFWNAVYIKMKTDSNYYRRFISLFYFKSSIMDAAAFLQDHHSLPSSQFRIYR